MYEMAFKILFDYDDILRVGNSRKWLSKNEFLSIVCADGRRKDRESKNYPKEYVITKAIFDEFYRRQGEISSKQMGQLCRLENYLKQTFYLTLKKMIRRGMVEYDDENDIYIVSPRFSIAMRRLADVWEKQFFESENESSA